MNDQSSAQSSRVYILYGVLIALLTVSIILVIVAGTRDNNTDLLPTPTPTTLPTPGITPITQEMLNQQFLPADHVVTVSETGPDIASITAKPGQSVEFTNDSVYPVSIEFLGVIQSVSSAGSYEVLLEAIGDLPYEIAINGNIYTGIVFVND